VDEYTAKTQTWLNRRYQKTKGQAVYFAHEPIYGLYDQNSEPNVIERYNRTYRILEVVAKLDAHSLLDVGAAEGYHAALVRDLLGLQVKCCDLAEEACARAKELFQIDARQADARALPYGNDEFDVVLCSETLEHINDSQAALEELIRVAKKAVIITVPHEPVELVAKNVESGELHAHINNFSSASLDHLKSRGFGVVARYYQSQYLFHPSHYIEQRRTLPHRPTWPVNLEMLSALLITVDPYLCKLVGQSYCLQFIILKDKKAWHPQRSKRVSVFDVLKYQVAHHHLI